MTDIILNRDQQQYLAIMDDLNKPRGDGLKVGLKTRLHKGQIDVLKPLYSGQVRDLFLPCGRKFGKSEVVAYVLWRHALLNPGSACYYVAPEAAHGRKIMWDRHRIQKFLDNDSRKYISSIKNQEMKLEFKMDRDWET